ncbi:MAG: hypothetical protein JXM69_19210 [Anaerolineae bacterium]|nr:hypothetical protein [Anaerolineae bacterium]
MAILTSEQKEYKERTLHQLQINLPLLETKLERETRPEVANSLRSQIEDTQAHIDLLQRELATNTAGEPVADELFQRAATALTKKKFYLARRLINKLETIEPFYPDIERLRKEAEAGRASRRTQAIAQRGTASTTDAAQLPGADLAAAAPLGDRVYQTSAEEPEKSGLAQFFQFHLIVSCLVVFLILCVMAGVGGVMLLQWLIEGG